MRSPGLFGIAHQQGSSPNVKAMTPVHTCFIQEELLWCIRTS